MVTHLQRLRIQLEGDIRWNVRAPKVRVQLPKRGGQSLQVVTVSGIANIQVARDYRRAPYIGREPANEYEPNAMIDEGP